MSDCPECGLPLPMHLGVCEECRKRKESLLSPAAPQVSSGLPPQEQKRYPSWFLRTLYGVIAGVVAFWVISLFLLTRVSREAARRTQCYGNYKGIVLTLHNILDERGELPAAWTADAAGRPLSSWRVEILRYLGDSTYQKYDRSRPWDDPVNQQLLPLRPRIFGCPSQANYESEFTHKAAVTGEGTVLEGAKPIRFDDIPDGLANTIYAGEITYRLEWSRPADVDWRTHGRIGDPQGFDGPHDRGIPFAFMDGSSRFLSRDIDPDVLRQMFLRNDGR